MSMATSGDLRPPRWEPPFPKGVDPALQRALLARTPRAWVTPALLWGSILPFVAMTFRGVDPWSPATDDIVRWGGNYGPLTLGGQWWRVLTTAFTHYGSRHLALNMSVLWLVGFFVERL